MTVQTVPPPVKEDGLAILDARHLQPRTSGRWRMSTADRFASCYVVDDAGHYIWTRPLMANGYGQFSLDSRSMPAHRAAYVLVHGDIPDELVVDHLCRVRACVNPDHLEAVTHLENVRRGINGQKTHCIAGHAFDDANTYRNPRGERGCRNCSREWARRSRAAQR